MKVSVLIVTYNQEAYIAQAVESALNQTVNFDYEIVIGEDNSTDRTRDILLDYQSKYPDKIRLLLREKNLGGHQNFVDTFNQCRGEYTAWLEGDDYWISPDKLQKQVDFLDSRPDYSICFHNARVVYEDGSHPDWNYCSEDQNPTSTIQDLFIKNFIPSPSVMNRRSALPEIPKWLSRLKLGDLPLHILHAQQGNIGYLNEVMAVYRMHPKGGWSSQSQTWQIREIIKMFQTLNISLDYKYDLAVEEALNYYYQLLISAAQEPFQEKINAISQAIAASEFEKEQLLHYQVAIQQIQEQLQQCQVELQQTQNELAQTQNELVQTQTDLQQSQTLLQQAQAGLSRLRAKRDDLKAQLKQSRSNAASLRSKLAQAKEEIAAMESSKFWKLRHKWIQFKSVLKLPTQ